MRVIYKASLVFLLTDIYSKSAVTTAIILCNGKQNPYTRKSDGYYVFSNLYPGKYNITIVCSGYINLEIPVVLRENETKIILSDVSYSANNPKIANIKRFDITVFENKKIVKNQDIKITLKNELNFLKLVSPIFADSYEVFLNKEMSRGLMAQRYTYILNNKEYELYFTGFDNDKKCYVLRDPAKEEIQIEGSLYPFWILKTDLKGRFILPFMAHFMKDDKIEFEIELNNKKTKISSILSENSKEDKIYYLKADLN